jgi:GT2 family glycosyltransferase
MTSVSVVLYKNTAAEVETVISMLRGARVIDRIYMIDNSPAPSLASTCSDYKCVYMWSGRNIGYGAGHNIALRKAVDDGGSYHLVMNADIAFDSDAIATLLRFMEAHPELGLLSPRIQYPDGATQYLCKRLPTPWVWFVRAFMRGSKYERKVNRWFELRDANYAQPMQVPYLSGCFMLFRISAIRSYGLFDERFFMYCEDTDIARRFYAAGVSLYWPGVLVTHQFAKGSHKQFRLFAIAVISTIKYFCKWGWFDEERDRINRLRDYAVTGIGTNIESGRTT